MPTTGQLVLLGLSIALFAAGGLCSLARLRQPSERLRIAAKGCMYSGILCNVAVIVWHAVAHSGWIPLHNSFDTLLWLAVLLALFVMYTQRVHPVAGLDWFIMPLVILLQALAMVAGLWDIRTYHPLVANTWLWLHRVTSFGGAIAFAVAAAAGAMYVISSRLLRHKRMPPPFGSLERIERMTMHSVTVGFAMLSLGLVTGVIEIFAHHTRTNPTKMLLACLAWVVYAFVLHAPFNPRFRGRRAALLSVFGFLLMIGTLVAVLLLPGGQS